MYRILIVEDDTGIREELKIYLQNSLYEVETVEDFTDVAGQIIHSAPDLVLLDVNLPGESGLTICSKVRAASNLPIIFVTSQNTTGDELNCILHGGDDYIAKPYNTQVLLARMAMVLKRTKKEEAGEKNRLTHGGVQLNLQTYKVSCHQKETELTKNEMRILYVLFLHAGTIVSRLDMVEYLWDNQVFIDDNTLSVNITRIRSKLEEIGVYDFIQTKRGLGYRI